MTDNIKPTVQEKSAWAKVPQEFNDWWNGDYSDESNPFRLNSAAYWAWAGWSEAVRLNAQAVPDGIPLNIIRKWPDGFDNRLQHVWLDVVSFIPSVKLYDLQRVLSEFGLRMEVYEDAPAAPQPAQPLTVPDAQEKDLLQAIQERDAADDYIDALLDEVLGTDRPEWSSVYGHADAIEQVRETMGSLMKPYVDKAWDRFQSALAAPAAPQPAQQTCNCRWAGDVQVQQCTLHQAHVEAIHEWAERAKTAEAKLNAQQSLTDEKDALLRQALDALEGFANITNDSQGVKGYHLNGDIAEWDEFDEVDAASSAIEAIRNHLGVEP